MENIRTYAKYKNKQLADSDKTYKSLFNIICDQGDRIFCEYFDMLQPKAVTYKQYKQLVYKAATCLKAKIKSSKNSFVGLYMENSINWVICFWAILMLGYRPLLLNCKLPDNINQEILELTNCKDVVYNSIAHKPNFKANFIAFPNEEELASAEEFDDNAEWGDEIALCTTASTMNFKVCVYNGEQMTNQLANAKHIIDCCPAIKKHYKGRLKLLAFLPFYHIFGLVATFLWFASFGRTIVILNDYSSDTILNTINFFKVTHIFSVPLFWNTITRAIINEIERQPDKLKKKFYKAQKLSINLQQAFPKSGQRIARKMFNQIITKTLGDSIKFIITGGSSIADTTLKLLNSIGYPLTNGYGSSELGILSVNMSNKIKSRISGTVGNFLPTYEVKIQDGKLFVKGSSSATYLILRDKTILPLANTWYDTQDTASVDKEGYYINGRNDDVFVNENGEKINPDLIEKKLDISSVKNFVVTKYKNKLSLIIQLSNNLTAYDYSKIINEVDLNVNKAFDEGYNIQSIYYTFDPIANKNAIKVSRKILDVLLSNNKVTLHKYSDLKKLEKVDDSKINKEIVLKIQEIFAPILDKKISELDANKHLIFDIGATSIEYMTCLIRLQKEFNITFSFKEHSCVSIEEFARYIIQYKKGENNDSSK